MTLLVITVTAVYAALVLWVPWTFAGEPMLLVFNTLLASFAVLVLIDPLRTELDRRLESWLFHDRSVLRALLDRLRRRLVNLIDPDEMVRVVMNTLRGSERVTRASLFLLDRQGFGVATARAHRRSPRRRRASTCATRRPLLEAHAAERPLLRDVLERQRERANNKHQAELDGAWTPSRRWAPASRCRSAASPASSSRAARRGYLLGVLFVDDERLLEPFSREEVELFEGVVAQAAVMIENSTVYEQRKERDRLAALGEMAAGLAHEIRNPLGAIKGAVQVVEPGLQNADPTTREFLGVIVEEVERLNRVVTQFLTYSRPYTGQMGPVALGDVVVTTMRLLDEDARGRVTLTQAANLPPVRGDAEALRQVLLNLLRDLRRPRRPDPARAGVRVAGFAAARPRRRRRGPPHGRGNGPRVRPRRAGQPVRAVPHHQGGGHRPGAAHQPADRGESPRAHRGQRPRGRRRPVHDRPARARPAARRTSGLTDPGFDQSALSDQVHRPKYNTASSSSTTNPTCARSSARCSSSSASRSTPSTTARRRARARCGPPRRGPSMPS